MSIINEALKKAQESNQEEGKKDLASSKEISEPLKPVIKSPPRKALRGLKAGKYIYIVIFVVIVIAVGFVFVKVAPSLLGHKKEPPKLYQGFSSLPTPVEPVKVETPAPTEGTDNLEAPVYPPSLVLNGIVYDERKPYAIINNRVLLKGEVIEEATLVEINKDSVKFVFKGKEYELNAK